MNLYGYVANDPVNFIDIEGFGAIKTAVLVGKWGVRFGKRLTRDAGRLLYKKKGKDIVCSKKYMKKLSKKKGSKPVMETHGQGSQHMHPGGRTRKTTTGKKGGHGFFVEGGAPVVVPGANLGRDTFGDNLVGNTVDSVFNPMSLLQDLADLDAATRPFPPGSVNM